MCMYGVIMVNWERFIDHTEIYSGCGCGCVWGVCECVPVSMTYSTKVMGRKVIDLQLYMYMYVIIMIVT
jgi:hypothetical protein